MLDPPLKNLKLIPTPPQIGGFFQPSSELSLNLFLESPPNKIQKSQTSSEFFLSFAYNSSDFSYA